MTVENGLNRTNLIVFSAKACLLQTQRALNNVLDAQVKPLPLFSSKPGSVVAQVITPLYTEDDPSERALQLGKVQNLRVAARRLNGRRLPAGTLFSFWAHIGRPSRAKGFVEGRECVRVVSSRLLPVVSAK